MKPRKPRVARPRKKRFTAERVRWLDEQLAQVALSCPWNQRNPPECPLCEVRKLPAAQVAAWLARLKPAEKEYLVLYHQCCLAIKWENIITESTPDEPA